MTSRLRKGLLLIFFLLPLFLVCSCDFLDHSLQVAENDPVTQNEGGDDYMLHDDQKQGSKPLIDQEVPVGLETATLALG